MPLAASLERAVTDSAELLLAIGVMLALVFAFTRNRIGVLRWPLLGVCLFALGAGTWRVRLLGAANEPVAEYELVIVRP